MEYILSSGDIENGIILENDTMTILDGGIATETTVDSDGVVNISSGGAAEWTYIISGMLRVYNGGTAKNTEVNEGGIFVVNSGGTATDIDAANGARLELAVASNTYIQGTSGGSAFEMKDAFISGYTVNNGLLYVYNGGTANNTTVTPQRYHERLKRRHGNQYRRFPWSSSVFYRSP